MPDILSITGPIFLLIALGFAAARWGVLAKAEMRVLGRFVITFALPALLFKALSQRSLSEILNGGYLLAYALGSLAALAFGIGVARWGRGKGLQESTIHGMGSAQSNSGFVGFPIVLQLLGTAAAVPLALTMLIENVLILPLVLALAEASAGSGEPWQRMVARSLKGLLQNPLILAITAGFMLALLEIRLPAPVVQAVDLLAGASSPVALFVIGGSLVGLRVKGLLGDVAVVAATKLLVHPLAVFAALLLLPPIDPALRLAAMAFACMPMFSIYPLLAQKYGQEGFSAAALLVTTLASFVTINAILWSVQTMAGWGI